MANQEQRAMALGPWTSGYLPDLGEVLIGRKGLTTALNVVYDLAGGLSRRKGYAAWSTSDPGGMNYGRYLWSWEESDGGDDHLLYVDEDDDLWHVDLGVGTTLARASDGGDITMGSSVKGAAGMDGKLYMTSRGTGGYACSFDGTTFAQLSDNNLDGVSPCFPLAKYLIHKHSRLFAANVDDGVTGVHPSRVWYSTPTDAEDWNSNSWIDVNPDDGSPITGLESVGDRIVIFKQAAFYVLSGTNANSFTMFPVSETVGMAPSGAAAEHDGRLYWLDRRSQGVYMYDGADFERIDDGVARQIFDNLGNPSSNDNYAYRVHGWRHMIYVSVSQDNADDFTTRTFAYDTRLKVWAEYDFGVQDTALVDNNVYAVGVSSGSTPAAGVVKIWKADDDDGSSIPVTITTPWFAMDDDFTNESRWRKLIPYMSGIIAADDVTFTQHGDFVVASSLATVNNDFVTTTAVYSAEELMGFAQAPKRAWKLKITTDTVKSWSIDKVDIVMSKRKLQAGDLR